MAFSSQASAFQPSQETAHTNALVFPRMCILTFKGTSKVSRTEAVRGTGLKQRRYGEIIRPLQARAETVTATRDAASLKLRLFQRRLWPN